MTVVASDLEIYKIFCLASVFVQGMDGEARHKIVSYLDNMTLSLIAMIGVGMYLNSMKIKRVRIQ